MSEHNCRNFLYILMIAMLSCVCLTGCNPRNLPGLRKVVEWQEERAEEYADELIEKSPVFQELNQLCTKEIPLYQGFAFAFKKASTKGNFLSYTYRSEADYGKVKSFYKNYFSQHGWEITKEYEGGLQVRELEVEKDQYRVILYEGAGEGVNYSFVCQKLPD